MGSFPEKHNDSQICIAKCRTVSYLTVTIKLGKSVAHVRIQKVLVDMRNY